MQGTHKIRHVAGATWVLLFPLALWNPVAVNWIEETYKELKSYPQEDINDLLWSKPTPVTTGRQRCETQAFTKMLMAQV